MKTKTQPCHAVLILLIQYLGFACSTVHADWDDGDLHSMHWPQPADGSTNGIAVNATIAFSPGYILFDDFLCTQGGPVTNIHIWGAQRGDALDPNVVFSLAIHSNQVGGVPGKRVWSETFSQGAYTVRPTANLSRGWLTPPDDLSFPQELQDYLQYNFAIDVSNAFVQTAGTVYWLAIQIQSIGQTYGWKTAEPASAWSNSARWASGSLTGLPVRVTQPLDYPAGHEFQGRPMDLAFVIGGGKPPTAEMDFGDAPDPTYPTLLASDGARHPVASGIYLGLSVDAETNGQPDHAASGDNLAGTSDEDGVVVPPLVKGSFALMTVVASTGSYLNAWADYNIDGDWADKGERIFNAQSLAAGTNLLFLTVPATADVGETFMRFRVSSVSNLSYTGQAPDGEVEDYRTILYQPAPSKAVLITNIMLTSSGDAATVSWRAESNVVYQVLASTNLVEHPAPVWRKIGGHVMGPDHVQMDTNVLCSWKYYRLHLPYAQ